jgi:hypothetical protein
MARTFRFLATAVASILFIFSQACSRAAPLPTLTVLAPSAMPLESFIPSPTPTVVQATQVNPPASPTPEIVDSPVSPTSTPQNPALPQIPQPPELRTHYALDVLLDYTAHLLTVEERITYYNTTSCDLNEVLLVVEARRYPGAFQLTGLHWSDGSRASQYQWKDRYLTLFPSQPLPPGASLEFSLSYILQPPNTSKLPEIRPYPFGYTDMQMNLGDWYPFAPPYIEGRGWLVHKPGFYGEYLVEAVADYDVAIQTVPEDAVLVIAASAPAESEDGWLRYHLPAARSFVWSASPYYQVLTQEVELGQGRSVTVASYFFSAYEQAGKRVLDTVSKAIKLFSQLYTPYTHTMMTAVQADFLDGMEFEGLFFLSKDFYNWHKPDSQEDFLTSLSAHETAHQWWYGLVGNDPAEEPWLDEALCTYSESLYFENTYPDALDWWWTYRVNYYGPQGQIDLSIYDIPNESGHYRAYRDSVYLNGAIFMQALRNLVGDQAFFSAMQAYAIKYAYRLANGKDFFEVFSQNSSQDLEPLLKVYFSEPPLE